MAKQSAGKAKRGCFGSFLVFLVIVEGILLAVGIGAFVYVNSMLGLMERPQEEASSLVEDAKEALTSLFTTSDDPIVNIMLVGQDMRDGEEHKLSDTMIICSFNTETNTLTLCSLMRDMYVKLPDYDGHICGKQRINAAYSLGYSWNGTQGAMDMLDLLVQEQFGVEIDYNVEIGFDAFTGIIDTLGGVEITLTEAEANYLNNLDTVSGTYTEGTCTLDGEAALGYARMRHSSAADSDFYRTGRQRTVISAVIEKCRDKSLVELNDLLTQVLPLIVTDMTNWEITRCAARILPKLGSTEIVSQQIPAEGTYQATTVQISGYDAAVLVPNLEQNRALLMSICEPSEELE